MSLFAINHPPEDTVTTLGYGAVSYELEVREHGTDEDGEEYTTEHWETVVVSGRVEETSRYIMITDSNNATVHVLHQRVDQIITCPTLGQWESYRMHADLHAAMGAEN
jgi:hypothetical protein